MVELVVKMSLDVVVHQIIVMEQALVMEVAKRLETIMDILNDGDGAGLE